MSKENPWTLKKKIVAGIVTLGVTAAGIGIAIEAPKILKDFGQPSQTETVKAPSIYDPNAEVNYIRAGVNGNAVPATPQEIKDFLASTPPAFVMPESGGQAPSINIIFPVDPENAKNVKIIKTTFDTRGNLSSPEDYYYYFETSQFYLDGDAIFNLPLIEGAQKVKVKIAIDRSQIAGLKLDYQLNDGRIVRGVLDFWDSSYTPTDTLKNIPTYIPSSDSQIDDLSPTQEFDLNQGSIPLFRPSGSTHVTLRFLDLSSGVSPSYQTKDGRIEY